MRYHSGHLTAILRECWVLRDNPRISAEFPHWTDKPTWRAIAVYAVEVEEAFRRGGECRAFLNQLVADGRYELVIVECVQNPILAEALLRWGWDCDPEVMDFYMHCSLERG